MWRLLKSFSESRHIFHFPSISLGRGVSQSSFWLFSSLIIDLPWIVTGATKPRGSKMLLTVDRTPRRVKGLASVAISKVKVSDFRLQFSPRLRCLGNMSKPRSKFLRSLAWSWDGKAFRTSLLFEAILYRFSLLHEKHLDRDQRWRGVVLLC